MARQIGVNTLVFQEEMQEGTKKQHEFFAELKKLNIPFVEVRREYFRDLENELAETAAKAEELGLDLFYSVPSSLFLQEKLNPELEQYFAEAEKLQARQLKVTLGQRPLDLAEAFQELKDILAKWKGMALSIENDQTVEAGSAKALADFSVEAFKHKVDLPLTFDTGNFVYIGEAPEEAAYILRDFTGYIHLKNVTLPAAGQIDLAHFKTGDLDLERILDVFREVTPAAIEYPCGSPAQAMDTLRSELEKATKA